MKNLVEGVARLATSFSQQAGDDKEPEESKNKRLRLVQSSRHSYTWIREEEKPQHKTASTVSTVLIAESLDMEGVTG